MPEDRMDRVRPGQSRPRETGVLPGFCRECGERRYPLRSCFTPIIRDLGNVHVALPQHRVSSFPGPDGRMGFTAKMPFKPADKCRSTVIGTDGVVKAGVAHWLQVDSRVELLASLPVHQDEFVELLNPVDRLSGEW